VPLAKQTARIEPIMQIQRRTQPVRPYVMTDNKLITCYNFCNLSTAQHMVMPEVGNISRRIHPSTAHATH
jgi:hypothetical protein